MEIRRLWIRIVLCVLLAEILGSLGCNIIAGSIGGWPVTLQLTPGTPPNAVLGPVWGSLWAMIGLAFALGWNYAPATCLYAGFFLLNR